MIMTTTPTIEGRPVKTYLGIVTGEAIVGANIFKDMFAAIRDVVGGRAAARRADCFRSCIAEHPITLPEGETITVTVSVGVAAAEDAGAAEGQFQVVAGARIRLPTQPLDHPLERASRQGFHPQVDPRPFAHLGQVHAGDANLREQEAGIHHDSQAIHGRH